MRSISPLRTARTTLLVASIVAVLAGFLSFRIGEPVAADRGSVIEARVERDSSGKPKLTARKVRPRSGKSRIDRGFLVTGIEWSRATSNGVLRMEPGYFVGTFQIEDVHRRVRGDVN